MPFKKAFILSLRTAARDSQRVTGDSALLLLILGNILISIKKRKNKRVKQASFKGALLGCNDSIQGLRPARDLAEHLNSLAVFMLEKRTTFRRTS